MRYRVNFGNGQVSQSFATRREADAYLAACRSYRGDPHSGSYFVQVRDVDGWWVQAPKRAAAVSSGRAVR